MSNRDLTRSGMKLLGVLLIALALPGLADMLANTISFHYRLIGWDVRWGAFIDLIKYDRNDGSPVRALGPLLQLLLGAYLLFFGRFVLNRIAPLDPLGPHCAECGYSLTKLKAARCPECGAATGA